MIKIRRSRSFVFCLAGCGVFTQLYWLHYAHHSYMDSVLEREARILERQRRPFLIDQNTNQWLATLHQKKVRRSQQRANKDEVSQLRLNRTKEELVAKNFSLDGLNFTEIWKLGKKLERSKQGLPKSSSSVHSNFNVPSDEDRMRLKKHRHRHWYHDQKKKEPAAASAANTASVHNSSSTTDDNNDDNDRVVLFVHFHKAGGTSMVHKFRTKGGYQLWKRNQNGNPVSPHNGAPVNRQKPSPNEAACALVPSQPSDDLLQIWRYSRSQFEAFLNDGRNQTAWPQCLLYNESLREVWDLPELPHPKRQQGVEFLALEWNFFQRQHFFEPGYLRQRAKLDLVTVLRNPLERFRSNFLFRFDNALGFDSPWEWAHLDLVRKRGRQDTQDSAQAFPVDKRKDGKPRPSISHRLVHLPNYQYGEQVSHGFHFRVGFNKPNYYTAFLNGMAEGVDDQASLELDAVDGGWNATAMDFDYFAFGLNQTHLEIAKRRLETLFDAVLILEEPETFRQLDQWFAFDANALGKLPVLNQMSAGEKKKVTEAYAQDDWGYLEPDEFYKYNALDKELYEFAVQLARSKTNSLA